MYALRMYARVRYNSLLKINVLRNFIATCKKCSLLISVHLTELAQQARMPAIQREVHFVQIKGALKNTFSMNEPFDCLPF